jgi:hypothetical protein
MFLIICQRETAGGGKVFIPIMKTGEDGDMLDSMGIWSTLHDAEDFCEQHILAKSSLNMIIDTTTDEITTY